MNGVTGTRPNAPFVGKVPTGKRATVDDSAFGEPTKAVNPFFDAKRRRLAVDDFGVEMPDFKEDAVLWRLRMRARLGGLLKSWGIVNPTNQRRLIDNAMQAAEAKRPGNERTARAALRKERQRMNRELRQMDSEKPTMRWIEDGLINFGIKPGIAKTIMLQTAVSDPSRPLVDRLVDVTMTAVNQYYNDREQHRGHWAAAHADPAVVALWHDIQVLGEEHEWGFQERIQKLNIALGSVHCIYAYPGTLEQARAAFDKTYCDKGDETVVAPAAQVASEAADLGPMFASFNELCKVHSVPENKTVRDRIRHEATGYSSWRGLPVGIQPGDLMTKTRAFVVAGSWKNWPADGVPETPPVSELDKMLNRKPDGTPNDNPTPEQETAPSKPVGIGDASAEAPERQSKPAEAAKAVATDKDSAPTTSKQEPRQSGTEKTIVEVAPVLAIPAKVPEAPVTVDGDTGEILLDFNPNRAIAMAKGKSALVNRLVQDKVLVDGVDYGKIPGSEKPMLYKPGAEKLLSAFSLYDKFTAIEITRDWKDGFFFYEYECTLYDRESGKAIGSGIGSCNSMEKKYRFRWVTRDSVPKNLKADDLTSKGGRISEPQFAIDKGETSGKWGKSEAYWKQFKDAIAAGTAVKSVKKNKDNRDTTWWEIDMTLYGIPNEDIFDLVNTISKMAQKRALVAAALNATGASAVFGQDMEDFTDFGMIDAA